jgi:hypothetical protein
MNTKLALNSEIYSSVELSDGKAPEWLNSLQPAPRSSAAMVAAGCLTSSPISQCNRVPPVGLLTAYRLGTFTQRHAPYGKTLQPVPG